MRARARRYDAHPPPHRPRQGRPTLKIERDEAPGLNRFTAYGDGWVDVNGARLTAGALVGAEEIVTPWGPAVIDHLESAHLEAILALAPEIVLLGTGRTFRFPHPALVAPLHEKRIGVEVMDTKAACRTYNILLAEGRRVVAAIIVD